jgi:hypothetical protein
MSAQPTGGTSGMANFKKGAAMTEHTHMLVTSIGTSFVVGLLIALALKGRLTLNVNAP